MGQRVCDLPPPSSTPMASPSFPQRERERSRNRQDDASTLRVYAALRVLSFRFVSFRLERSFSKNRSIPRAFLGENEVIEVAVINLRQGLSRFQHLASLLTQSRNRFLPIIRGKRENIIRTDERWREDIADPVISGILFFTSNKTSSTSGSTKSEENGEKRRKEKGATKERYYRCRSRIVVPRRLIIRDAIDISILELGFGDPVRSRAAGKKDRRFY